VQVLAKAFEQKQQRSCLIVVLQLQVAAYPQLSLTACSRNHRKRINPVLTGDSEGCFPSGI